MLSKRSRLKMESGEPFKSSDVAAWWLAAAMDEVRARAIIREEKLKRREQMAQQRDQSVKEAPERLRQMAADMRAKLARK